METFIGDIVTLAIETNVDLSGQTLEIMYRKPDDTEGYWNATIHPTDHSVALYTTQESDLDIVGTWKIQVFAHDINSRSHGKFAEFRVKTPITV